MPGSYSAWMVGDPSNLMRRFEVLRSDLDVWMFGRLHASAGRSGYVRNDRVVRLGEVEQGSLSS